MSDVLLFGIVLSIIVGGFWLWAEIDRWLARRRRERKRQRRLIADTAFDEAERRRAVEQLRREGW